MMKRHCLAHTSQVSRTQRPVTFASPAKLLAVCCLARPSPAAWVGRLSAAVRRPFCALQQSTTVRRLQNPNLNSVTSQTPQTRRSSPIGSRLPCSNLTTLSRPLGNLLLEREAPDPRARARPTHAGPSAPASSSPPPNTPLAARQLPWYGYEHAK